MDPNQERKKWDEIYASLPLAEENKAVESFNKELLETVQELLPEGTKTLEAGCGGGQQSLALARDHRFKVTLLDFSRPALNYARKLFEREGCEADYIQADIQALGHAGFDLVFNAGVLEHYSLDDQVKLVQGMASYSRRFVLVLVPNRLCNWYWLWRMQKKAAGEWPYGEEVPVADLSAVFSRAGLHFLGQKFMGATWTESFVEYVAGLSDDLRSEILAVHRSGMLPASQRSYLVAGLGCVDENVSPPSGWDDPRVTETFDSAILYAESSDALAARLGMEWKASHLEEKVSGLELNLKDREAHVAQLAQQVASLELLVAHQGKSIAEKDGQINHLGQQIESLVKDYTAQESRLSADLASARALNAEITRSRAWKLIQWLWKIRLFFIPVHSRRENTIRKTRRLVKDVPLKLRSWVRRSLISLTPSPIKAYLNEYRKETPLVDNSTVTVFATLELFPDYSPHRDIDPSHLPDKRIKISLITTILNEKEHAAAWMESLQKQSRLPDELVVVDGGSHDGTVEIIKKYAAGMPFAVKIFVKPGANISAGRNHAIQNASYNLIACSDMGSTLKETWLEYLILPFELDESIQVSCGYNQASDAESPYARLFFTPLETFNPQNFLPSGRSIAFYRSAWARAGGYPEWLTDAGEDTVFDFNLKRLPLHWAFVPQANVSWYGPRSLAKVYKTARRYSFGDGEAGIFAGRYWVKAKRNLALLFSSFAGMAALIVLALLGPWWLLGGAVILALALAASLIRLTAGQPFLKGIKSLFYLRLVSLAQVVGFAGGVANRPAVRQRQASSVKEELRAILQKYPARRGIVIYPPTHDWGFMFQRPQQIARAFARQGYLFFYCTNNEKIDTVVSFQEVEERLVLSHVPLQVFGEIQSPILYLGAAVLKNTIPNFSNPFVIYDHYDDLVVSSAQMEDHDQLLREAQIVITTSQRLFDAAQLKRPDLLFLPNGVDYEFIASQRELRPGLVPADLQEICSRGQPVIGYSGALASWFDYELLEWIAKLRPALEFVLIGTNYDGSLDQSRLLSLPNVHWLGLKNYGVLFEYVFCFDVAIIPFKVNEITLSTSPIKLFEYAACGKPIVSTPLPESKRYSEVLIAATAEDFAAALDRALERRNDAAFIKQLDELARRNTWSQRVTILDGAIQKHNFKENGTAS